jgi:hypothetical protein
MVNIQGIDKLRLLEALWTRSQPAAFFRMQGISPPPFNMNEAQKAVHQYIDYFCGRVIKCDLSGNEADPWGYDRDNGNGAFQSVVNSLRN